MQNAPVVVANHAAVDATFTPVVVSGTEVIFEDLTAATVAARNRLVTRPGRWTKTRPTNKPFLGTEVPIVRDINGVSTVIGMIRINTEAVYSIDATTSEIRNAYAYHKNAMSNDLIVAQIRDLDYTT